MSTYNEVMTFESYKIEKHTRYTCTCTAIIMLKIVPILVYQKMKGIELNLNVKCYRELYFKNTLR